MKNLGVFHLFAIHLFTISLALIPASVRGQDVVVDVGSDPVNDAGFSIGWDSVQDRVVLSRDVTSSDAVAAKILGVDGSRVLIKPLKFLPGAQFVDIWSAAPAPDGGAVLATIVGYGPKGSKPPVKAFLMSFDGGGNLAKLWNVEPYHEHSKRSEPTMRTFVFSRTLREIDDPGVQVVTSDAVEFVRRLKQEPGKDICLMGGGELAQSLLAAGLVDKIGLNIHPILLGSGIPTFRDFGHRIKLTLTECRTLEGGCILANYNVSCEHTDS